MRREYDCPKCEKLLNPGSAVIFVVEQGQQRELVLLSPIVGEYSIIYPESFQLTLGDLYTFRCPLCHGDLTSEVDDRLVELRSRLGETSCRVSFSRVFGEQATFVYDDEHIERYGEHVTRYEPLNFFGEARIRGTE